MRWRRLLLGLSMGLALHGAAQALPSFEQTRQAHRVSDFTLLDRHGVPVQTLRLDKQQRVLPWVALDQVSPALLRAVLLSEDRRFYEHSGVDWSAVAASAWGNLWNTRTRGASTLTMQLAGLLDEELSRTRERRSSAQKLGQVWVAGQLERSWSKAQILEAYLNRMPLRGDLVGVNAAAQALFAKSPAGLDAREAALLAALLRAPNAKPAQVAARACGLLQLEARAGSAADCAALDAQAAQAFARRAGMPQGEQLAPHYARLALRADGPNAQRSSLDAGLQRQALALLRQQLGELQGHQVEDGALLVLDNASGEVLAWVGSSGAYSDAPEVDAVLSRRQPGSTLKPFVYELALERRLITAASLLDDSPAEIRTGAGLYQPQNYDHRFRGWVSARAALGNSLNVPAVRVGAMLGPDALVERLNALGLKLPESGGFYGPALALGSADVSLLALANAYRALANGGLYTPPRLPGQPASAARRVADPAASFIVTDMLADNNARALTFGLDSALATRGFAAVKTGTSKDMRDNWCLGFSDRYTVGVWVGNASGEAMHQVSGVSGAAPVWAGLMRYLHAGSPSRAPRPPAGVIALQTQFDAVQEASRREWFLPGTELARVQGGEQAAQRAQGIRSPRDGSIYALDPDIPPAAQRLQFEGAPGIWRLDGRRLASGSRYTWRPMPGRHELSLLSAQGQLLETVHFEVRGASLKR